MLFGYCLCLRPNKLELIGLLVTVGGVACMLNDSKAEREDGKKGGFLVYAVCFLGALAMAFFMVINGLLVKAFPIFTLLAVQALIGYVYLSAFMLLAFSSEFSLFSLDPHWGGFGFLDEGEAFAAIVCYGLSCGFFGNAGYVICLLFFSPVIVSACFLFEPFLSQMFGYWMDIDRFPGWLTWVGTFLVLVGILLIQKADRQRKKEMTEK